MKRRFAVMIAALLIAAMAGCANNSSNSDNSKPTSPASTVQTSNEPSESSQGITALYANLDSCKIKIDEKRLISINSDIGAMRPSDLMFSSDDESIAIVDSSGNVIGRAAGSCVITVSSKDKPAVNVKIPITVKPNAESSAVQQSSAQASKQETQQSSSSNDGGGTTTIIYVTPSGESSVSLPQQYTYYYGRNNFSYDNLSDGYRVYSMINTYLSSSDVKKITSDDAQMLINAIYAKYGYSFSTPKIRTFFNNQSWYYPTTTDMGSISAKISKNDMDNHNFSLLKPIAG